MTIHEFFKEDGLTDGDTMNDFIRFVAGIDEVTTEEVNRLNYSKEVWSQYRDEFLDV